MTKFVLIFMVFTGDVEFPRSIITERFDTIEECRTKAVALTSVTKSSAWECEPLTARSK